MVNFFTLEDPIRDLWGGVLYNLIQYALLTPLLDGWISWGTV